MSVKGNLPGLLIVEDEKNTRDGLRRALEDKFDVYLAADVRAAWNVLETEPVDHLLSPTCASAPRAAWTSWPRPGACRSPPSAS